MKSSEWFNLTPRENEVLSYIVRGKTDPEIADALKVTVHTLHAYRKSLLQKLQANNVASMVRIAIVNRIVEP